MTNAAKRVKFGAPEKIATHPLIGCPIRRLRAPRSTPQYPSAGFGAMHAVPSRESLWILTAQRRRLTAVISGFSVLRKRRLTLALWIAPALLFRALIPAGFMLEPVDGRAQIVLCGAEARSAMHHPGGHDHAGHQHFHPDPTCPYAQAAGAAPLPSIQALGATPVATVFVPPTGRQLTYAQFGPARQHSPRAPPRLA